MLWIIAVLLVALWCLGLMTGYAENPWIDGLFATAVIVLVVSIRQETRVEEALNKTDRARIVRKVYSGGIGL